MMQRCLAFLLGVGILACGPRTLAPLGEVKIHVATDAPLPSANGNAPPDIPALFDRIRIAIYEPGSVDPCSGCTREFDINSTMARDGKISFGLLPKAGISGYRAKIEMFRSIAIEQGLPIPRATVTHVVSLPVVNAEGIVDVGVFLSVDDLGKEHGSRDAPEAPLAGDPDYSKVGSWAGAQHLHCAGAPKPGEVCVMGGAFWMGNPLISSQSGDDNSQPHLVIVSPFFMDSTEETVSTFRASGLAKVVAGKSVDPIDPPNPGDLSVPQFFCTFTTNTGKNELLPLNCVSWSKASEYCKARGSDLPTEAQFEFAAGGLASNLYPWGDDPPSCDDAVYGRGGVGAFSATRAVCRPMGTNGGPVLSGTGTLDRVHLEGGTIFDLGGNVSEWAQDQWNRSTEGCWTAALLTDPRCTQTSTSDGAANTIRGGSWPTSFNSLQSAQRFSNVGGTPRPQTGFRCARSAN